MTSETAMCMRCGIVNVVRSGTRNYLCESCSVYWGHSAVTPCERCGKRRRTDNQHDTLCGHCVREPAHLSVLADGEWVRDGLVWHWKANPPKFNGCGTEAAYSRHRRHGENPCDECMEAHRIHRAKQRAAQKREVA